MTWQPFLSRINVTWQTLSFTKHTRMRLWRHANPHKSYLSHANQQDEAFLFHSMTPRRMLSLIYMRNWVEVRGDSSQPTTYTRCGTRPCMISMLVKVTSHCFPLCKPSIARRVSTKQRQIQYNIGREPQRMNDWNSIKVKRNRRIDRKGRRVSGRSAGQE